MEQEKSCESSESESQDVFIFDDLDNLDIENKATLKLGIEDEFDVPDRSKRRSIDTELDIHHFVSSESLHNAVLNDFKVISVIGKGSYGKVFQVQKLDDGKAFAMKVLKKASIVLRGKDIENTMNERQILEKISHPFIVKLFYAFQSPSKLYLILTLAAGGELFSRLAQEKIFTSKVARFYISEILLALEHIHSLSIIYRDLKPENVMLDHEGHILLTDFGLSKVALDAKTVCGTIIFMAPEILEERASYSNVVDYWSLGVMLFDMVVGSPPFTGSNRKKVHESILQKKPKFPQYITQDTRDLCTKLLKKNPTVRLGVKGTNEIKKHAFFNEIDWELALNRGMQVPYIPPIHYSDGIADTLHFSKDFTSLPIESFDGDSQVKPKSSENLFRGFSFEAPSYH